MLRLSILYILHMYLYISFAFFTYLAKIPKIYKSVFPIIQLAKIQNLANIRDWRNKIIRKFSYTKSSKMSKIFHIPKFSLFCCDPKIDRNFHFVQSLNTKIKQKTSEIIQVNVPKMWILEPKSVFSILHIMYVGIDAILIL